MSPGPKHVTSDVSIPTDGGVRQSDVPAEISADAGATLPRADSAFSTPAKELLGSRVHALLDEFEANVAAYRTSSAQALERGDFGATFDSWAADVRQFLTDCEGHLKEDFGLKLLMPDVAAVYTTAQTIAGQLSTFRQGFGLAEATFNDDGDSAGNMLFTKFERATTEIMREMHSLIYQRAIDLILEPRLDVPYDPTINLSEVEEVIDELTAMREAAYAADGTIDDYQVGVTKTFGQAILAMRFMADSTESARLKSGFSGAMTDMVEMVPTMEKHYRMNRGWVLVHAPDDISDKIGELIKRVDREFAVRKEALKYELREAWARLLAEQRAAKDQLPKVED